MEKFENLILKISTLFINFSEEQLDDHINVSLRTIGEYYGVDRCYLFTFSEDRRFISNTHEWCREGITPQRKNLQRVALAERPWLRECFSRKEVIDVYAITQLPAKARLEKQDFQAQDIKSLLVVPLLRNTEMVGFIGFDAVRATRRWQTSEINLLKIVADIFTNALDRLNIMRSLSQSEQMYHLLVDKINDGLVISQNDRFVFVNRRLAELLGYQPQELVGRDYREIFSRKGQQLLLERQKMRHSGLIPPATYETTFLHKDGSEVEVEVHPVIAEYRGAIATFAIISDNTARRQFERIRQNMEIKMLKHQRLATLGLQIAPVFQNIKSALTVIMGRAQMLLVHQPEQKELELIIANVKKIDNLLTKLIAKIAREQDDQPTAIHLNELLKSELLFMEADPLFRQQVTKKLQLQYNLPTITGQYIDFTQSLSTILQFCTQGLATAAIRELTVTTYADAHSLTLEISTSKAALSATEVDRLFVPGFIKSEMAQDATADQAISIKFGIYNAFLLLTSYQARIEVSDEPAGGLRFTILFPLS